MWGVGRCLVALPKADSPQSPRVIGSSPRPGIQASGEAMSADRSETVLVILPTGRAKHVRQKAALRMIVNGEVDLVCRNPLTLKTQQGQPATPPLPLLEFLSFFLLIHLILIHKVQASVAIHLTPAST